MLLHHSISRWIIKIILYDVEALLVKVVGWRPSDEEVVEHFFFFFWIFIRISRAKPWIVSIRIIVIMYSKSDHSQFILCYQTTHHFGTNEIAFPIRKFVQFNWRMKHLYKWSWWNFIPRDECSNLEISHMFITLRHREQHTEGPPLVHVIHACMATQSLCRAPLSKSLLHQYPNPDKLS